MQFLTLLSWSVHFCDISTILDWTACFHIYIRMSIQMTLTCMHYLHTLISSTRSWKHIHSSYQTLVLAKLTTEFVIHFNVIIIEMSRQWKNKPTEEFCMEIWWLYYCYYSEGLGLESVLHISWIFHGFVLLSWITQSFCGISTYLKEVLAR